MGSMLPYIAAPWILWDMNFPFLVTRLILFSREIPRAVSCGKAGELRFAPNENDPWRRDGADRYRGSFYRFEKREG